MWLAGIAWRAAGYEVVVLDEDGQEVTDTVYFDGAQIAQLVDFIRSMHIRRDGALGAVIDSTNGLVDGHLLAAGLPAYRLDPWSLPPRPADGSVPARTLARAAWGCLAAPGRGADLAAPGRGADPAALTHLTSEGGTLTGRSGDLRADTARSADVERELAEAGRCYYRGGADVPEVALTFDDGPDPVCTGEVLAVLRDYAVPATFFCVGLGASGHPDLVARIAADGHAIGNHTWSHPCLSDLSRDEVLRQVDSTNEILATVTGQTPTMLRPPFGARTPDVLRWIADHDMTTVLWEVDACDWSRPGVPAIVERTVAATTAGSIVLLHDGGGDRTQTVAALPGILEGLLECGYRLVRADRLTPATS